MNIIEGIQQESDRVRTIIAEYEKIPAGGLAAELMKVTIKQSEIAVAMGDTIAMISMYEELKGFEL